MGEYRQKVVTLLGVDDDRPSATVVDSDEDLTAVMNAAAEKGFAVEIHAAQTPQETLRQLGRS